MKTKTMTTKKFLSISFLSYGILLLLTGLLGPRLVEAFYPLPVDQGPSWYFWQTSATEGIVRASYIIGYLFHQIILWYLLVKRRKQATGVSAGIGLDNLLILGVNVVFVLLHLLQTHIWYDGLAKDVPIWTSQGSVIVMLVLVLYMMLPIRGLFFGKRFTPPVHMMRFIQRWHGMFISWAIVYTFWFHPMEGNWGLLSGFLYMFLLFIQIQLVGTKMHLNKIWIVLLESFVTIHGTLITVYKHNEIWPMFLFGFLAMFVFTQAYTWKMRPQYKWLIVVVYAVSVLLVYGTIRGFEHIYEITFIPVALYGGAAALVLIGWIWDRVAKR